MKRAPKATGQIQPVKVACQYGKDHTHELRISVVCMDQGVCPGYEAPADEDELLSAGFVRMGKGRSADKEQAKLWRTRALRLLEAAKRWKNSGPSGSDVVEKVKALDNLVDEASREGWESEEK